MKLRLTNEVTNLSVERIAAIRETRGPWTAAIAHFLR